MKKIKRSFVIELPEAVWKTLDKYGYDYEKNFQEQAEDVAYWIWVEENSDESDKDIGSATVEEMRKQNGDY